MRRGSQTVVVAVAVLLLATQGAVAQERDAAQERALRLFEQSREHYRAGRFQQAADLLREAHRLQPEPILLYNLARALEGAGDLDGAIKNYETYLRDERRVPDRGAIEQKISTLKRLIDERQQLERQQQELRARATPADVRSGPPPPEPRSGLRRVGPWIVAGVGVAALVGGSICGALALERHGAATDDPVQQSAAQAQSQAQSYATTANVLLVAGGVVAAAGVIWLILDWPRGEGPAPAAARRGLRVAFGPGSLTLRGEFP